MTLNLLALVWENTETEQNNNIVDFDNFLRMMEEWFIQTGAAKFTSDKIQRDRCCLTEEECKGFHQIIKAFFYEFNFQESSKLIEDGKEFYQDLESSILDLNTKGKFYLATMSEKSDALERCKELQLSFSKIVSEFNANPDIKTVKFLLDQILILFDVLDSITLDFEKNMIKPTIHGIYSCIINTNILDSFIKILGFIDDEDASIAKVTTLRILCHLSTGLMTFNSPIENVFPLIVDEGYYHILDEKLRQPELLICIRNCIDSSCVEVCEQACITLGYFVMNNLDLRKPLEDFSIVSILLKTISLEQVSSINEYALWCLFNICRKYLPIADKIVCSQEEDVIYSIAFKIGEMLFGMETSSISCFCYMILTCGYIFDHIIQYPKELKLLCDKIVELVECQDVTIINCCFITITRSIRSDSRFTGFFNTPELFTSMQKFILSPTESSLVKNIISFIKEISNENLFTFENKLFTSLFFIHQSQSRAAKDVIQIFTNVLKTNGSKVLIKQSKDFIKFALGSINDFKSENDKIIESVYHKNILTIDISYLLSALEMLYNLSMETSNDTLASDVTVDKVNKLDDTALFFYDCYSQWEGDRTFSSSNTDSIIEECCNIFLEVIKELGTKITNTHVSGFSRDKGANSAKVRLQTIVENLENKIYKIGPIEAEHKYKTSDVIIKVYDLYSQDNREFQLPYDFRFSELEREIIDRYKIKYPLIQFEDQSRDKITIDSEYALEHALKIADEISRKYRYDQLVLDVFLSDRPGYIFNCLNCRSDFLSDSKYGNNEYCDRCEDERRNYRRPATPVIGRSYTSSHHTPAPRSRITNSNFTRAQTHRTYTPLRSRY